MNLSRPPFSYSYHLIFPKVCNALCDIGVFNVLLIPKDKLWLQNIIYSLDGYYRKWSLVVNLNKSKILVFRNGVRPATYEKLIFKGKWMEVANRYLCLGETFASLLSLNECLQDKPLKARDVINSFSNIILILCRAV